jgi:GNAT superfamily N-acetyltransferase
MKFYVRRADTTKPETITMLCYLQKKILPSDDIFMPTTGYWWFVNNDQGKAVGFAGMVRSIRWTDTGYLCRAGILDEYTGNGLQKRLIRVRIKQARKLGWNWIITDTTNNPPSANSLINAGFKIYKPGCPWSTRTAIYWKYKVKPNAVQRREYKKAKVQRVQP